MRLYTSLASHAPERLRVISLSIVVYIVCRFIYKYCGIRLV